MQSLLIALVAALLLVLGFDQYQDVRQERDQLSLKVSTLTDHLDKAEAQHQRDLALINKTSSAINSINRLSHDLKEQLNSLAGCVSQPIGADVIERVRNARGSHPVSAGANPSSADTTGTATRP